MVKCLLVLASSGGLGFADFHITETTACQQGGTLATGYFNLLGRDPASPLRRQCTVHGELLFELAPDEQLPLEDAQRAVNVVQDLGFAVPQVADGTHFEGWQALHLEHSLEDLAELEKQIAVEEAAASEAAQSTPALGVLASLLASALLSQFLNPPGVVLADSDAPESAEASADAYCEENCGPWRTSFVVLSYLAFTYSFVSLLFIATAALKPADVLYSAKRLEEQEAAAGAAVREAAAAAAAAALSGSSTAAAKRLAEAEAARDKQIALRVRLREQQIRVLQRINYNVEKGRGAFVSCIFFSTAAAIAYVPLVYPAYVVYMVWCINQLVMLLTFVLGMQMGMDVLNFLVPGLPWSSIIRYIHRTSRMARLTRQAPKAAGPPADGKQLDSPATVLIAGVTLLPAGSLE